MIVLDINVLSEPLKARPDPLVLEWMANLTGEVAVTAISVGELLSGAGRLAPGRRRTGLLVAIEQTLTAFAEAVLPYDGAAARAYAQMQGARRQAGSPLSVEDGMIAATCSVHDAGLATRNIKNFEDLGLRLVDPWAAQA